MLLVGCGIVQAVAIEDSGRVARPSAATTGGSRMPDSNDPPSQSQQYRLPPPFTPQEFWAKLLELLKETDGDVTFEKFEQVFDIPSTRGKYQANNRVYQAGADWYFKTMVIDARNVAPGTFEGAAGPYSQLRINLPIDAFGDWRQGACVLAGDAIKALTDSGWKLQTKQAWALTKDRMVDVFVKGNAELGINHYAYYLGDPHSMNDDATCVTNINVRTRL